MNFILVSYDLNRGSRTDYEDLHNELKSGGQWWHYLESTWILATDESPREVWARLETYVDAKDRVIVVKLDEKLRQGWLPKKAWDWFRRYSGG